MQMHDDLAFGGSEGEAKYKRSAPRHKKPTVSALNGQGSRWTEATCKVAEIHLAHLAAHRLPLSIQRESPRVPKSPNVEDENETNKKERDRDPRGLVHFVTSTVTFDR